MIREGTTFQGQIVLFREMGQRLSMFTLPENRRCTCLENLALERIVKMIRRTNGSVYWKVDGEYTEYSGENYVRIRRAVLAPPTEIPDHDPAP